MDTDKAQLQAYGERPATERKYRPVVQTFSGRLLNFLSPDPDDIHLLDIVVGLARETRFANQAQKRLSVAFHSIQVALHAADLMASQEAIPAREAFIFAALLHDASEAYTGDITAPLKALLPEFRHIENQIQQAVMVKYGLRLTPTEKKVLKQADVEVCYEEARHFVDYERHPGHWKGVWEYPHVPLPLRGYKYDAGRDALAFATALLHYAPEEHRTELTRDLLTIDSGSAGAAALLDI